VYTVNQVNELMQAIVAAAPPGVPVMMRYPWHRSWVDSSIRGGIGFHNNYFAAGYWQAYPTCTNTSPWTPSPCGPPNSDFYNPQRTQHWVGKNHLGRDVYQYDNFFSDVMAASPNVMLDAEMAWNLGPNDSQYGGVAPYCAGKPADVNAPYHPNIGLDGIVSAQRLQSMHYTTLSVTHNNADEATKGWSTFGCWRQKQVSASDLASAGLPLDPAYFQNVTGTRSVFEYIRDHLGYRLRLTHADFAPVVNDTFSVKVSVVNDGFSAPHIPRTAFLVLLDQAGARVRQQALSAEWTTWQGACATEYQADGVWTTRNAPCPAATYTLQGTLDAAGLPAGTYSLGLWLPDAHDALRGNPKYAVRVANGDTPWVGPLGVNKLATFVLTQ
jgi:hypothetical protein